MKKSLIFLALMLVMANINVRAQYSEAQFRIYQRGYSNYSFYPIQELDSMAFVTDDYDVYVSASPTINENGKEITIGGNKRLLVYYVEVGQKRRVFSRKNQYKAHKDTKID